MSPEGRWWETIYVRRRGTNLFKIIKICCCQLFKNEFHIHRGKNSMNTHNLKLMSIYMTPLATKNIYKITFSILFDVSSFWSFLEFEINIFYTVIFFDVITTLSICLWCSSVVSLLYFSLMKSGLMDKDFLMYYWLGLKYQTDNVSLLENISVKLLASNN